MKSIKDINHVPVAPKHWKDPINGHKIQWNSNTVPFLTFLSQISAYWQANHPDQPEPTREQIEDELCQQMAGWACVGQGYHRAASPASRASGATGRGGCRTCGQRR